MAKLTFALIAALLVITATVSSAYRTTITTVEVDETNPRGQEQQCREQIQRQDLGVCGQYMMQSRGGSRGSREIIVELPEQEQQQGRRMLEQCCDKIKQMSDECQCEGIQAVTRSLLERGEIRKEQYEGVMQKARDIPSSCGVRGRCDIRTMMF
ncbi:2S seed storage albumin protein-like [Mercurialis annua]|uniref:2S seed storage albumin protein-like n=1 Tax=Mercurialis annua TaxID=3986 RepID=UPI00215E4B57|nr:2S seed storage albumin protein-like [Mercurialis annua]